MLEPDLINYLIAGLPRAGGRVHLGNAPQSTALPVVVVIRISGSTPRTLGNTKLFSRANLQMHIVGDDDYQSVLALANDLLALIDGFKGDMGTTRIESCRCDGEPSDTSYIDGTKTFRQLTSDFKFVYRDLI